MFLIQKLTNGVMKPPNTNGWLRKTNTPSSAIFQNPKRVEVSPVTQVNTKIFENNATNNGPLLENLPPTDLRFAINRSREQSRYDEAFRARYERANRPHYMINFVQAPIYILAPIQLQQHRQLFQQNH